MGWKTMDVRQQRVEFVVAATRGEKPFSRLCEEFGVSRPTGYLWWKRYRSGGLEGIAEQSRKPHASPTRIRESLEEQVMALRRRYPDWGARKLSVLLERSGQQLPPSTIHRILRRHDLVRDRLQSSRCCQRFERSHPNELWQMDFKGPSGWNQEVGPLSILDDHSRYLIGLRALGSTQAEPVREQLEEAFLRCGVPEAMLMDHGIPWWGPRSPLGLTKISVWLMQQGIRLYWSGVRHPQTQGKVERFHGTLLRSIQRRRLWEQRTQQWLDDYRWEYNHLRPHEALGMKTPAKVWQPSRRKYQPHPAGWEYPEGAVLRKVDADGKLQVGGQQWHLSRALNRQWVQIVAVEQRVLVYYCTTLIRELDFSIQRSTIVDRWIEDPF
ncbi:IS481 family transposase [Alloacidobacterium dinghuense]|uniref:IS481 family transposase n=2 Tax=Alloacidobacterium dinghuense TaxID=2763107 RepID=A0A7G8BQX4_9BACT|nr:IS481 family transposase [Alloacidobacterium dinghuense]QNI34944.1 IS481 family transposase [Alloacidobacterium dinghuense]QNI35086.1 IS481 family transposase [Alloacidobacterium dinghuense]